MRASRLIVACIVLSVLPGIIATRNQSATTMAETAQKFGQENDITVVTILRAPVLKPVAASA
jgi:hypothetical protein